MENWTVKAVDGEEQKSAAEREEAVLEQHAPQQEEPQAYQTPTNDDGDFVVNLDQPVNTEADAIQEREAETVDVGERTADSQEVVEEVRVEPNEEHVVAEPVQETGSAENTDDDFGVIEVNVEDEAEPQQQEIAEETVLDQVEQAIENNIELPEGIDKLVEFMNETGGTVEDYLNLNIDVSKMNEVDVLREYYRQTKPHFDADDIEFDLNKKFYYEQDVDDPNDIRAKQLAFKEELYKAQQHLNSNKERYYQELKLNPKHVSPEYQEAMNFYQDNQKRQAESQKLVSNFQQKTDNLFNDEFKGFDFKVGDKKFRVKVGDVNKTKEFQKDINNWINGFIGDDGTVNNVAEYHKGLYVAQHADKLAQHFYEQGRADAIKQSAAQAKNIDMKPRQDAASVVTPSGQKFRVVSGDSGSKLRIKMKQ